MTSTLSPTAQAAQTVTDYFGRVVTALDGWRDALAADMIVALADGALTSDRLDRLVEPYAINTFDTLDLPVYGAGFIAAVGALEDAPSHLAWWQGADRAKLVLAAQSVSKEQIDYSELEWYRVPRETGRAHVAGPYVDYLCSDEYTITVATPLHLGSDFLGVAGVDLLIDQVERDLTPRLAAHGSDVSVINGVGRLLISTSPHRVTGDTIKGEALNDFEQIFCGGMDLAVLAGDRRH